MRALFLFFGCILFVREAKCEQYPLRFEGIFQEYGERRLDLIAKFLPENPVIFEAGGHYGTDTTRFAEKWPGSRIISFEPNPNAFNKLLEKTKEMENVHVYNLAVNDYNGSAILNVCYGTTGDNPIFEGASSLLEPSVCMEVHYQGPKVEVPCVVLEDWCRSNGIDQIDFMWLDLEGLELQALSSSPKLLEQAKVIYTETNFFEFRKGMTLFHELKKFLEDSGFRLLSHWYREGLLGAAIFVKRELFDLGFRLSSKEILPSSQPHANTIHYCTTRTLEDGTLKSSLLEMLQAIFELDSFVETGTYLGDTTVKAAHLFQQIHTIELSRILHAKAYRRLKEWKHINVHYGDSKDILYRLISPLKDKRALFYLDGHYSGQGTALGSLASPLLQELKAIAQMHTTYAIILIDDIRLCQETCFPEKLHSLHLGLETYPHLKEIVRTILEINPSYRICFLGDALLAFPESSNVSVSPVVRACAMHRLGDLCADLTPEDWGNADRVIAQASGIEKEEIGVYYQTYAPFELEYGYRCYGAFWYALIRKADGYEDEAQALLKKVVANSMPNWRVSQ